MNSIRLSGDIAKEPIFSHEVYGEKFYEFELSVARQSGVDDCLVCIASGIFLDVLDSNKAVSVMGEIRTRNVHSQDGDKEKNHLQIFVFVKNVTEYDTFCDINDVEIDGYICKPTVYRQTPLGREVGDMIIACNRHYGKCDYIPAISWGRNARRVGDMEVGTHISAIGRLQSREYIKDLEDGSQIRRVAYELSVSRIEEVGEEE